MNLTTRIRRAGTRILAACLLALIALPAFALGLGQIKVMSRPGEPLLAEIPIVSSNPAELQGLQARLAAPDTFRRIGLQPPQGIVSDLQFAPAVDALGKPVIRVTSRAPVQQAALTFLLEVDWGQGRLVREYQAVVDAPRAVQAAAAPSVDAPVIAPAQVIQRPAPPPVAVEPGPPPAQPPVQAQRPAPAPAQAPPPPPAAPRPAPVATPTPPPVAEAREPATRVAPSPAPRPQPQPQPQPQAPPAPPAAPASSELPPVERGDTLARIATGLPGTEGYSLNQTMLALLRANPDAFIGEDINRLRQGAVLRVPGSAELSRYSQAEANAMVREQVANWRESRRAVAQPVSASGEPAPAATPAAPDRQAAAAQPAAAAPRTANARLEIAPPQSSAAARAGTQSGASAGGEGDKLRQELQQTKETLAARDAEVQDLKARVAELEKLQQDQQKLIAMKDDALAGAQQRLATAGEVQPAAAPPPAPAAEPLSSGMSWWWLLPFVLLVGALVWWRLRAGRKDAAPVARQNSVAAQADADAEGKPEPVPATAADAPPATLPNWAGKQKPTATSAAPSETPVGENPTWMSVGTAAESIAPLNHAPAGRDRIELARAYVELGDRATARSLLQEVVDSGDPQASEEARRALQQLG